MNGTTATALLLGLGVLAGSARLLWAHRPGGPRVWRWRTALLLIGQTATAALLYLTMFPPPGRTAPDSLVVVTGGATPEQLARIEQLDRAVALPEAPEGIAARRMPDLATALRRFPGVQRLEVIGTGLPPRDLQAASALSLAFEPAPLPRGVVELWSPPQVFSGSSWHVTGRVHGVPAGSVELLDPAQRAIARVALDRDGRFTLRAEARAPGRELFRVRVTDDAQLVVEDTELPVLTVAGTPLRVLLLAGAPGAELKYLRRWAVDAGVRLQSEMVLRPGVSVRDPAAAGALDEPGELDAVILDERAWRALGASGRDRLVAAVRDGLGLILRIGGTLADAERGELRRLGFDVSDADVSRTARLDDLPTPVTRRQLRVDAPDGVPLLRDSRGEPLALWRTEGRGRVALWWLSDSFRIALDGSPAAYGSLWSSAFETVSRPRDLRRPEFAIQHLRVGERQVICGLSADATVRSPDGTRIPLLVDAAGCAAYWPGAPGWHAVGDDDGSFYVRDAEAATALLANESRTATAAIATDRTAPATTESPARVPGSPWPYFLACLIALGGTWWLERRR